MTSFDLIRKAIRYEPVPRPPVAVLDGYNWFLKRNGMTEQDLYAMSEEEMRAAAERLRVYRRYVRKVCDATGWDEKTDEEKENYNATIQDLLTATGCELLPA